MAYMSTNVSLRENPNKLLSDAKTILTLGVSYYQGDLPEKPGAGFGRVARYAWGLDYHDVIIDRLNQFLQALKTKLGCEIKAVTAVDTKPLMERSLAAVSHLGFIGKNTVLISPQSSAGFHVGSWIFLAEILIDQDLMIENTPPPALGGCGACARCLDACPTRAFDGPYRLNSNKCISYLTIENKGPIPRELRSKIGDWIFGCDICQDVCPFNARAARTQWPEFEPARGTGAWISLRDILNIPNQKAFELKFGKTPLSRPKRRGLLRNACVAAGNSRAASLVTDLAPLLDDPEPLIRGHALWAMGQLAPSKKVKIWAEKILSHETNQGVIEECQAHL